MAKDKDLIITLHGLRRDSRILSKLEGKLRESDYDVWNPNYPSTRYSIEKIVDDLLEELTLQLGRYSSERVHFVGHSLGGIITRLLIARYKPDNLGKVVMIAPPNKGSEVVDFMRRFKHYRNTFGLAGQQIGTDENSIVWSLPPVDYELGVIAGDRTRDPWFSWFILPGANDGKVSIESTKVEGMKEHLVVHAAHPALPSKKEVIAQIIYFLQHGKFQKN